MSESGLYPWCFEVLYSQWHWFAKWCAKDDKDEEEDDSSLCCTEDGRPELEPHERHQYAVKEMERIIHEFELFTENSISAQELCGALLQHVLRLTDSKRKVLENPDLYGKRLKAKDRKRRDSEIVAKMSKAPGKLDHASIVAYEVGHYHGNDDEDYEIESEEELDNISTTITEETNGETSSTTPPAPPVRQISFESAVWFLFCIHTSKICLAFPAFLLIVLGIETENGVYYIWYNYDINSYRLLCFLYLF